MEHRGAARCIGAAEATDQRDRRDLPGASGQPQPLSLARTVPGQRPPGAIRPPATAASGAWRLARGEG